MNPCHFGDFAERITAIKAPRILDVEGFFFSYWWYS